MIPAGAYPTPPRRLRWFHLIILITLLLIGGVLRSHQIARESLTLDEYWTLYLATGRGNQLFDIPYGTVVHSPPPVGFAGAPAWWHIWTGISSTTHPPLYHVALRWWVDLFGDRDGPIRAMSTLFCLAAAFVLFDLMRRIAGPWHGLFAAGIMLFAPAQIDYSQLARPYTMLVFFGALLCDALIAIDRTGPSPLKIAILAAAAMAMALTHYFSLGAILASLIYIAVRFRGRRRKLAIAAILAGLLLAAILWGPVLFNIWRQYSAYQNYTKGHTGGILELAQLILIIPLQLFLDPSHHWPWTAIIPLSLLIFVTPLFRFRRSPEMLLWWLWIICTIGMVAAIDLSRDSTLVAVVRYIFLSSPAIYAILATPLPGRLGAMVPLLMFLCAIPFGLSRVQTGPEQSTDWRLLSHQLHQMIGPHDAVALTGYYDVEPANHYFVIAHYTGEWKSPVIFLSDPISKPAMSQLASYAHVWMVGHFSDLETRQFLPGWRVGVQHAVGTSNAFWQVLPPNSSDLAPARNAEKK